jgi:stearoyl-CoA desaturase (delta-9 desaturase)
MGASRPPSPNSPESSNGKRTATRSHAARSNSTQQSPTVYLHRHLAHRGVELRPEVRGASRFLIWVSSGMKPRQWTQVHRYHHAGEDTPNDPHSPTNFGGGRRGARYVFWHNGPLYTRATRDPHLAEKYRDLAADRWDRWFFDHGQVGVLFGVAIACARWGSSAMRSSADGSE